MILSICIPTLPEPKSQQHLANLMAILSPQLNDQVELVIDDRGRNVPTGTKRNDMYAKAQGEYVVSVDCDDWVSPDYISEIIKAAESKPDVITFDGYMTTNGIAKVDWIIKLGEKYEARQDADGITRYYRFPNHIVPIKRSIATQVRFPDIWQGEDYAWAVKVKDLLRTEIHIYKQLYHYKFITDK